MEAARLERVVAVNDEVRRLEEKLKPLVGPSLTKEEIRSKPLVLVIGQYSTGKTSLVCSLCGAEYGGAHIGPEPTTEKFVAVVSALEPSVKQGNYVSMLETLPFGGLRAYGASFLSRFVAAFTKKKKKNKKNDGSPVGEIDDDEDLLSKVIFIDTPGVLSGEKQRLSRQYDFASVCRWFAERAELVLLLFDAHKLDISDEFRDIIAGLSGMESKVRCVLNKADQVDAERLVRVYGALMFNIGKILKTPEVVRVYCGSFWDQPLHHADHRAMFEADRAALLGEMHALPSTAAARKIDDLVKHCRSAVVRAHLARYVRAHYVPGAFLLWRQGAHADRAAKTRAIGDLAAIYERVRELEPDLSEGDFPALADFAASLDHLPSLGRLPHVTDATLRALVNLVDDKIPRLLDDDKNNNNNNNSMMPAFTDNGHDDHDGKKTRAALALSSGSPSKQQRTTTNTTTTSEKKKTIGAGGPMFLLILSIAVLAGAVGAAGRADDLRALLPKVRAAAAGLFARAADLTRTVKHTVAVPLTDHFQGAAAS